MEILEPELRALHGYWLEKSGGRAMPARADIDPVDIPQLLPHLILIDTAATIDDFRYRLFGTEVCRGFGHDRTGVRLGDIREGVDNFDEVYGGYWRCFTEAAPDYFHGRIVSLAKDFLRYSRLLLPLSDDDGGAVNMLVGAMVFFRRDPL